MTWIIIRKELLDNMLSYKFLIAVLLCFTVIPTSNFVLLADYQKRLEDYSINVPRDGEARASKRPSALSIYAKGLDDYMGRSFEVRNPWRAIEPTSGQRRVNLVFSLFSTPDFSYVAKVLMSLLAIMFAFDAVSGEKANGTLALMNSCQVPRSSILLGKWIGGFLSLLMPFIAATLLGLLIVMLSPALSFSTDDWGRIGFIVLSSVIYISIFFFLGLFVSSRTSTPKTSIVVLLFLWAVLVFGIPNIGALLARKIVRLPSVQSLEDAKNQARFEMVYKASNRLVDGPWIEQLKAKHESLEKDYRNRLNQFIEVSKTICRISPLSSYVFAVSGLARTSYEDEQRFKEAVVRFRDEVTWSGEWKLKAIDPFIYQEPTLRETFRNGVLLDFGLMMIFNILFFLGAYLSFLKYDVR